ncbi:hypothetical protein L1987_65706 [Smallanthus sonchifolius]|uniref:Uncharacterized protein n=1 Tax=Smallanthus sonchifolius TaxID=185202 RepID=A0ACB9BV97_9ASTR|nr:hypothetical protein L1987_65706 [Smallanthus sonchifolius]
MFEIELMDTNMLNTNLLGKDIVSGNDTLFWKDYRNKKAWIKIANQFTQRMSLRFVIGSFEDVKDFLT